MYLITYTDARGSAALYRARGYACTPHELPREIRRTALRAGALSDVKWRRVADEQTARLLAASEGRRFLTERAATNHGERRTR